ncbi:FH2 domain-containing protein 1-like [Xiphophorus couchianus]|uniref:FH2 domain-containing protein 1-like n=1 Tax=Xiphophorus couchianus TaxID=32473 RepID=UPI001015E34C|nr:FH2 domain-containing protein 1-like [Xiphophorus couchianus]
MHVMGSVSPANDIQGFSFQEDAAVAEAMSPPSALRFSHNSKNGTQLIENLPPPPPPAPLPPPPPPPPPLLPADNPGGMKKKKRVRSFFWKTIPAEQVKGHANLWTQGPVQQDFQIDVQKIEELFTQSDGPPVSTPTRGGKTRVSFREAKDEVSILDSKRGLNIAIFLKQFKRSNQTLVDEIRHGNSESFGAEPLRELLKLLPEKDEVKKLKAYRGDVSKLSLADSFIYLLTHLPSYSVRIESMLLKEEFPASCDAMKRDFKILRSATKELMCCKELHAVLHLVLQAGNILNAGGSAGNAVGFKLSSLLSLADTKSNKPGMNLLHFVALEAQKKDQKLLEFPLKLNHIQAASRISMETLDAELQLLTSRTRSVEESIQKDTELLQQLDSFLQSATSSLCSLRGGQQQLKKDGRELIDFFCEDRDSFRLDDCFSIFQTFCTKFTNAAKENKEREAKETARRQRMHEEELKRHSWSGGEEVTGALGWRCRSETDMSTAAKDEVGLLLDLLNPKSQSRSSLNTKHVTRGRSGNFQRNRNSPSSSPSLVAERELSAMLEKSNDLRVPRQRGKEDTKKHFPSTSSKLEPGVSGLSPTKVLTHSETPTRRNPENIDEARKDVNKDEVPVKSTSDSKQQSELNNSGNNSTIVSSDEKLPNSPTESRLRNETADQTSRRQSAVCSTTAAKGNMSVLLERCTLVPELKVFDSTTTTRMGGGDSLTAGPEEQGADKPQNNSQEIEKNIEEQEKVIVWCVTGVCEAASENTPLHTEKDQQGGKTQGEKQQTSSATSTSSEAQADGQTTETVPISSQPVPVSRSNNPGLHPIIPASPNPDPTLTAEAPEKAKMINSTDQRTDVAPGSEETSDNISINKKTLRQRTVESSSTSGKAKPETSTKNSTKKSLNSRTGNTGVKPSNTTSTGGRSIRTLTSSENQNMRRIVPMTRANPGSSSRDKKPEKPPANTRSSSRTTSLNIPSPRQGEKPGSAPASQRSGSTKTPESKEQNQDLEGRPSVRKPLKKPKTQTEEKMCLSKLRTLNQVGGGSVSAPVTPLHKSRTPSSSALPGFTRNTASSSFRRTKPPLSHPPNTSSPKSSPKTASSSSRATDLLNTSSSSTLKRSQSARSSAPSPLHNSLAPPKGHTRNDSGSDKSTHSKDWSKASRPSWR